jgi:hypothetical protein
MKDVFLIQIRTTRLCIFSHSFQHFVGIERMPQAVTSRVDGDDGQEGDQPGEEGQPGILDYPDFRVKSIP